MDNLTHSLVGAVLGQAGLKRTTGLAMPALIIGANLPDVDAACFFWLEGTEHLAFRRGITHGPLALVLLPLILAGLLWGWDRWQTRRGTRPEARLPVRFGWLYAMAFIGCLTHPAMDWLNVYGIRLLEPFSSEWFYGDTLFIVDPWLWTMLIAGIWVSRRRETAGGEWMRPARVGIAVGLAYVGLNWGISQVERERVAETLPHLECSDTAVSCDWTVIASPVPLVPWQREMIMTFGDGQWSIGSDSVGTCNVWRAMESARGNPQADAFLFWSRAPFATRAADGSVILRDARFTDPRVGDRFSVPSPGVECIPLHQFPDIDLPEPAAP